MSEPLVIVVGAGVAGLACARELQRRGVTCRVLERARGVGGRCATRSIEDQRVDFGVPLLHATTREFGLALQELPEAGKFSGWPINVREPRLACQPAAFQPGHRRLARRAGVSEFPRHLAVDLDVRLGARVTSLEAAGPRTAVVLADGSRFEAPFVVLATHLPETLRLIEPIASEWAGAAELQRALHSVMGLRCLTVMAGYPTDTPEPGFDLWYPLETTMIHAIIHDSSKREAPRHRVLVIQSRDLYAGDAWEQPDATWRDELLWEAAEVLGPWARTPVFVHTHRWEWARLRRGDGIGEVVTLESPERAAVSLCGEAFATHPGVEAAYFSGIAIGEQIATLPRVREVVRAAGPTHA
ncbi:MAG: NAD(P)-binding protein [Candidatus Eisenbacteria bacterium]|uniref:NAD(P)-binding protein n=1 Tax=Eiseniibacteriota bacterium TaxID=2212470 RepID=A0A849SSP1_UNCEI|nr:NAD(P)-binding protein [Candidatus Eisenbacteria bacterium]